MGTTARGYPYEELTDAPNGPVQNEALAAAIDADVTAVEAKRLVDGALMRLVRTGGNVITATVAGVHVANYDGTGYDNGGGITQGTGGDLGKLIVPSAQVGQKAYRWYAEIEFPSGSGQVQAWVEVNGTVFSAGRCSIPLSGSHQSWMNAGGPVLVLSASDKVGLVVASPDGDLANVSVLTFELQAQR